MEEKYSITLNTGKTFDNLTMNGTMYVSQTEIKKSDFEGIRRAVISNGETEIIINDAICDTVLHWPEGYLFNIREMTMQEKQTIMLEDINMALVELANMIAEG